LTRAGTLASLAGFARSARRVTRTAVCRVARCVGTRRATDRETERAAATDTTRARLGSTTCDAARAAIGGVDLRIEALATTRAEARGTAALSVRAYLIGRALVAATAAVLRVALFIDAAHTRAEIRRAARRADTRSRFAHLRQRARGTARATILVAISQRHAA